MLTIFRSTDEYCVVLHHILKNMKGIFGSHLRTLNFLTDVYKDKRYIYLHLPSLEVLNKHVLQLLISNFVSSRTYVAHENIVIYIKSCIRAGLNLHS